MVSSVFYLYFTFTYKLRAIVDILHLFSFIDEKNQGFGKIKIFAPSYSVNR